MVERTETLPVKRKQPVPKRVKINEANDRAELYVSRKLFAYLKALEHLALGVTVEGVFKKGDKKGETFIYKEPPDFKAASYLIDRVMGRLPQRMEITGEDSGPVEIIAWGQPKEQEDIVDAEVVEVDADSN